MSLPSVWRSVGSGRCWGGQGRWLRLRQRSCRSHTNSSASARHSIENVSAQEAPPPCLAARWCEGFRLGIGSGECWDDGGWSDAVDKARFHRQRYCVPGPCTAKEQTGQRKASAQGHHGSDRLSGPPRAGGRAKAERDGVRDARTSRTFWVRPSTLKGLGRIGLPGSKPTPRSNISC